MKILLLSATAILVLIGIWAFSHKKETTDQERYQIADIYLVNVGKDIEAHTEATLLMAKKGLELAEQDINQIYNDSLKNLLLDRCTSLRISLAFTGNK